MKQHGVDKMFWLEKGPLLVGEGARNVVYLTRGGIGGMKIIAGELSVLGV